MSAQEHLNGQLFEGSITGGTPQLFPSAPYLSDRARYPRGFTPERLRAVRAAASGIDPRKDHPSRAAASAAVSETIAASTVPIDHIRGRGEGGVGFYVGPRVLQNQDAAGQYDSDGRRGSIKIREGFERTATPIHEIGHHVSATREQTPHSAYDTTSHMGQEEAYAENYAEQHWRDRRGRPNPRNRITADAWTAGGQRGGTYGGFHEAYAAERKKSPAVQTRLQRIAARDQRTMQGLDHPLIPEGHVPGQLPLLAGTGDKHHPHFDWDYTDDDKKRGRKRTTPTKTETTPRAAAWWQS